MHRRQPHHTRASEATRPGSRAPGHREPGCWVNLAIFKCFIICKLQCPLKQGGRATNLATAGHGELNRAEGMTTSDEFPGPGPGVPVAGARKRGWAKRGP